MTSDVADGALVLAVTIATISFMPQALQIRTTNSTELNETTCWCIVAAIVLLTVHDALSDSPVFVVASCVQIVVLLYVIVRVRRNKLPSAASSPASIPIAFK